MSQDWVVSEGDSGALLGSDSPTNGRHEHIAELVRQHNDALVRYVYRFVHSRDDARDIVQQAYYRFFRLDDPTVVNQFRSYLFRTAKHIAIDWIRQRVTRESFLREESLRSTHVSPSPEQVWAARDELIAFVRWIDELPPKAKKALIMIKIEDKSYEEVAEKLGIKVHSARRLVERALEHLVHAASEEDSASMVNR